MSDELREFEVNCIECRAKVLDVGITCNNNNRISQGKIPLFTYYKFKCPFCSHNNTSDIFPGSLIYDGVDGISVVMSEVDQLDNKATKYSITLDITKK